MIIKAQLETFVYVDYLNFKIKQYPMFKFDMRARASICFLAVPVSTYATSNFLKNVFDVV